VLRPKGLGGVVVGASISHHHRHSAWKRTEPREVYGDTWMTKMDWAMGADGDTALTEMDRATCSIYLGHPGVDRISSHSVSHHLISPYHRSYYVLDLFPSLDITRSVRHLMHPHNSVHPHHLVVSYLIALFLHSSSQNCSFSLIPFGISQEV
jgi:hypothetical protein